MADSNVTLSTATMLHAKVDSLEIGSSLPDVRYQKNKKKIKISVDDKVEWSYKWTKTFAPPLGKDLITVPLSSTMKIAFFGKRRIRDHLLGSYSGRVIDLLLDKDKLLTLRNDQHGTCATITLGLSPVTDYQQALMASVDASLARLNNNPRLEEGLDNVDQANSSMQAAYSAVKTCGQYIAPLGQALLLMMKLIDNVAEAHPLLKLGWMLLSSVYRAVQEQQLNDENVRGLAESLREVVGVASECPVAEIKGTPDVMESIERLALEVASLIDEYTKSSLMVRVGKVQITDVTARITNCQAELKDVYEKLRTRIMAYTANRVKETEERIKETHEDAKRRDAQKLSNKIRKWLKAHNPSINHKSARDICVEGTGSWFPKDERFLKWLNDPGTKLWISGRPGFGKTVLFSTSVEAVRTHASMQGARCCCAYSYFDARASGGASRKFESLLRSILDQLCFNRADVPDAMKRLYGFDSNEHPEPTLAQLRITLGEVVKGFDDVYILIDALDECDSQAELLDWMTSLQSTTPGLHLLATSRPERIIEERMSSSSHVCISLNSELLDNDIKTYVDERVEASDDLKLLMTEEMKKRLRLQGDGMFRLIAFWIDELKDCRSPSTFRAKLEHLPASLNDMYTSMISKIKADDLQYAKAILPWLLFSVEQLKLEEIAAAGWFGYSDGRPAFDKDRGFADPKAVLDVFGGLVVMSDDGVTLAHLTVKEFLLEQESALHVNEPDAHSFIARCCLTYLLDQFSLRIAAGVQGFPLHDYAIENWMPHASSTRGIEDTTSAIYELALQLLDPEQETFQLWSSAWDTVVPWCRNAYSTPLFVCAEWGFQTLTTRLLLLGVGALAQSESGCTALHLASQYGHLEVVKMLLDGPDITIDPAAAGADVQVHIIELADVNMNDRYSGTPLNLACLGGHMNIVEQLLEKGADVNPQGEHSDTPLSLACSGGHTEIVQLLLEKGADINSQGNHFDTPLSSACSGGHIEIVQLLLEKGADINPQGNLSDTPLSSACSGGHIKIVELLLEKGADINLQGKHSYTPLSSACSGGHIEIVELLLEKGADINPQGKYSYTPLRSACSRGHIEIVELLLEKGAEINPRGNHSYTPLSSACSRGHIDIVQLLLQKGADINPQGNLSDTPLSSACSGGHIEIVQLLLEEGADINPQGNLSDTPLSSACSRGHIEIVELLLAKGADVNLHVDDPQDPEESLTPLHVACYCGRTTIVELLLQNDADLAAQSKSLNTALHFASRRGRLDVLQLLLEKGADPNVQNKALRTPLDLARNKVDGYYDFHDLASSDDFCDDFFDDNDPAPIEDYNKIVAVLSAAASVVVTTLS